MFSIFLALIFLAITIECYRRELLSWKREQQAGKWPVDGHNTLSDAYHTHRADSLSKRDLCRYLRKRGVSMDAIRAAVRQWRKVVQR